MPYKESWGEKAKARAKRRKAYFAQYHKKRDRKKVLARKAVELAILRGDLFRLPCNECRSKVKIEGHHPDYDKPLEVIWLCFLCHRKLHRLQNISKGKVIKKCSMCDKKHLARGYCLNHWRWAMKNGIIKLSNHNNLRGDR